MTSESTSPPNGAALPDSGTADLVGYGRMTWAELTRMLGDAPTAWAGYDGFHIGSPPAEPPPYSHLWAWTDHWLLRARIDADQAIVGVLALTGFPPGAPPALFSETVAYQRATGARTWAATEGRVGPMPADLAGRPAEVFLISGEHPVTFVSVGTPG